MEILKKPFIIISIILLTASFVKGQDNETYAEKLGWEKGQKVIIFHVDDAGMSFDSNQGAIEAMEKGVATSVSLMMPCPWIPGMVKYLKAHPTVDAGLHLTLTSEWEDYRWGPLTGITSSPGLVDEEGAMYPTVGGVVKNASADEVEAEIRAQLARARKMGFDPTHLDSHMGTLMATPEFLERYIKVGMQEKIPVLFSGGNNYFLMEKVKNDSIALLKSQGKSVENRKINIQPVQNQLAAIGKQIWDSGLPVVDDLHYTSYDWKFPENLKDSDENLKNWKVEKYIDVLKSAQPGITMVLMHCTNPTEVFPHITDSGNTRKADLLAMTAPELKKYIEDNGIVLTTWRELKERRDKVASSQNKK
ncbi:MAG TPA: polysaccharide deacetylase family protein [Cytophagales bacterium]|nr:polysaccharide deacetylase family protein [Cytophagales bacterium]